MLNTGSGGTAVQLPRSLPRGRNALPRDVVLVSQAHRLLEAVVGAVGEHGYAATRVTDIVSRAGVSRGTFYQQFRDKEECFLAAYAAGSRRLFRAVSEAGLTEAEPLARLHAGTRAYLQTIAAEPAWSRTFLIDIRAVPAAEDRRREVHGWYVDLLRHWHRWARPRLGGHPVPDSAFEACVDAVNERVARRVARGNLARLTDLTPDILYIDLALMGFPEQAAATADQAAATSPGGAP